MNACYALEPTSMKTRWQVCRVPMFSRTGCAGLSKKGFVKLAVDVCQGEHRYALRIDVGCGWSCV